ncbi:PREDICTED: beta-defensin 130-like [Miniopterus natalensis]|uniref:beta-defensin 130-like n=1 Tax=Miniopterus natalensis TaxID=291302 RepID=UPI0007A71705|nr:PREDICTED: beta-defensin 130-like [Miniopterus natalensis]
MRLQPLLSVLLLFVTIVPKARPGVIPGLKQCLILKGVCKATSCTSTDDTIGVCSDDKKCCRKWWILYPYPTPAPKAKSP